MAATTTRGSGFPPGPRLPRLVQTLGFIFSRRASSTPAAGATATS